MKSTIWICALGAAFVAAQAAKADTVSGSYNFTDTTNNNALTVVAVPDPGSFTEHGVSDQGIAYTDYTFFNVVENIPGVGNTTQSDNLTVDFDITQPGTGSGSQSGQGVEAEVTGLFNPDTGSITWNAPAEIALSDGQTLYIDLGDINLSDFGIVGGCPLLNDLCGTETATFTLTPTPAATPEPGSLALLGTSILGGAGILRRRFVRS